MRRDAERISGIIEAYALIAAYLQFAIIDGF
jgi:hypothetical protein